MALIAACWNEWTCHHNRGFLGGGVEELQHGLAEGDSPKRFFLKLGGNSQWARTSFVLWRFFFYLLTSPSLPFSWTYVIKLCPEQICKHFWWDREEVEAGEELKKRHCCVWKYQLKSWVYVPCLASQHNLLSTKAWWEKIILYRRINIKSHFIWRKMHWCQTLIQFMSSAIFLGKHALLYMTLLSRLSIAMGNHPSLQNVAYSVLWKVKVFHCTKMTFNFSYLLVVLEWILADLMQFSSLAV